MQERILFLRAEITNGGKPVYELVDEAGNSKGLFAVVPVQEWETTEQLGQNANEKIKILTKVYAYVNQIKVYLSTKNNTGVWRVLNKLNEYLVSVDCSQTQPALSAAPADMDSIEMSGKCSVCGNEISILISTSGSQ